MANSDLKTRQYILDHMIAAVDATEVCNDPSPHIVTKGFFPDDVYADILSQLPEEELYLANSEKHHTQNGYMNRKSFTFISKFLNKLPRSQAQLWYDIRGVLGSVDLKEGVYQKLRDALAFRFDSDPSSNDTFPGFAEPGLFRETEGYKIKPHPDTRRKVVTMQVALPKDDSQIGLGTEFYRRSLKMTSWKWESLGFETVKTMPFLPNTCFAFVVLNTRKIKSWHGRSTLPEGSGVRNTILNIWYAKTEDANLEIIAEQAAQKKSRQGTRSALTKAA